MNELKSKIILKGVIENLSPLIIGKGRGDIIDLELIKDEEGNIFIPGTSFAGAIKHYIMENFIPLNTKEWIYFWGFEQEDKDENKKVQSHFVVNDLFPLNNFKIKIRDGIAIDNKRGITEERALFNYEILEPGTNFNLEIEITIREEMDIIGFKTILKTIINELENQKIRIGAMTTKGFGKIVLKNYKVYEFNFPADGEKWFHFLNGTTIKETLLDDLTGLTKKSQKNFLEIQASFHIKNSIIIGSNIMDLEGSDKINIQSNEKPVIPGTSIKGAIRARAEKIINTFGRDGKEELKKIFGFASKKEKIEDNHKIKQKIEDKYKSRVYFEEIIINDAEEYTQNRIKIDRFTGGTIEGALFNSTPIWHKNENINIKIFLKEAEEWEVGLLLLILKDLWTEDLPLGGEKSIGRGILKGLYAIIRFNDEEFKIKERDNGLFIEGDKEKLERYVKAFIIKMGGLK
ncbi:MAG: RAMP superfamily CRISPR-associated protein [Promethearchaeota archaeon]